MSRDNCQAPIASPACRSSADRIRLIAILDDPAPTPLGSTGTVTAVRQQRTWAQVDVAWDNGRTLMLVVPPDEFEVLAGKDKR